MKRNLRDKVVVVTGGARGIGRATAQALVHAGAKVAIGDVDDVTLKETALDIGAHQHGLLDVTDADGFTRFLDEVAATLGPVDALINNAGIMPVGNLHAEPRAITDKMVAINVLGVMHGTKAALDVMLPRRSGHIVNVASLAGVVYAAGAATYTGTKHAVVGFTESARYEYAGSGVDFTTVLPMFVNTELTSGTPGLKFVKNVEPEDVAAGILEVLQQPRARVYVPRIGAALAKVQVLVPPGLMQRLNASLGGRTAFLSDVDAAERRAYDERISRS